MSSQSLPERSLTSEDTISHCSRFASKHRNTEPADVDIGGKADDSEGEEYGELEEDPGLWFRSSFVPLLLDFLGEISATDLAAVRLPIRHPLGHLKRVERWGRATS
jgi:hypothetical protein